MTETRDFPTAVIASLSSGVLLCEFGKMHEAAEYLMGHPIWTHHFADKNLWGEMQRTIAEQCPGMPTDLPDVTKENWEVAGVDQNVAEQLVIREHYSKGASNTATYLHGLYPRGWLWYAHCVGVAWWIPPTRSAAEAWAGEAWEGVLALSRLAIEPDVPPNACSFLVSKSVRKIDRTRWHTLVSYADKWRGHTGAIYLACGWEYCGETKPEAVYTIKGRMTARKAGGRTRTHAEMLALGSVFEGRFSKSRFCLRRTQQEKVDR